VGAGVDWDWELTAVTLSAIFIGVALLAMARPDEERPASNRFRYGALAIAVAIGAAGFVFLVGNMFLSRAQAAASHGKWTTAIHDANRASDWLPWSTAPIMERGEAQLALGQTAKAQASFRSAISKDRSDWNLWFDLARASNGATQRQALAQASKLNPLSPEIAEFRTELGSSSGINLTAGGGG
jgi:predicted Zn-dependent protease